MRCLVLGLCVSGILWSVGAQAAPQPALDIRFCPSAQVRTYPAESRRGVQSLLLQNLSVANRSGRRIDVRTIRIELLRNDVVVDTRTVSGDDLQVIADKGRKLAAAGVFSAVPFQFCGTDLIPSTTRLGGPTLAPDEALLVADEAFMYNGARDTLRVRVEGYAGDEPVSASRSLPISAVFSKTNFIFPLRGVWYAGNGPTLHTPHRWALPEEFAFDIAKLGANGLSHTGDGTRFTDYYAYGASVLAAADGHVVAVENGVAEDPTAMQRPDESQASYFARLLNEQATRLSKGLISIVGNYVMIDHGGSEYSLYAHLQRGSVTVHPGENVKAGDVIGKLGSSGNSTEPHLHFQVCDKPDPLMCAGIPVNFTNVVVLWADLPRPIQSGDVVETK